jgi:hypothetical protein
MNIFWAVGTADLALGPGTFFVLRRADRFRQTGLLPPLRPIECIRQPPGHRCSPVSTPLATESSRNGDA